MEKETLEEAAERNGAGRHSFILGAKYMAEKMYSEEEVLKLLVNFSNDRTFLKKDVVIRWFDRFKKK